MTKVRTGARQSANLEGAVDRSPVLLFRLTLHGLLCVAILLLGFRLSREALIVIISYKLPENTSFWNTFSGLNSNVNLSNSGGKVAVTSEFIKRGAQSLAHLSPLSITRLKPSGELESRRGHVGRHEILIRPWPHPDPLQTIVAHRLIEIVQEQQIQSYGFRVQKQLIIITPTYVRTFQAVHLTCLSHTFRILPGPLIWIVVEAGGISIETAAFLKDSGVSFHHLGFQESMPVAYEEKQLMKRRLRLEGLRFVSEQKLDGIIIFADESNIYKIEFFEEVQKVQWVGVLSMGWFFEYKPGDQTDFHNMSFLVQGTACNSIGEVSKLYPHMEPSIEDKENFIQGLDWSSFVLNARLLWEEQELFKWTRTWKECLQEKETGSQTCLNAPLDLLNNLSYVEPLGTCGQDVLVWRLQVDSDAFSKFPARWVINPYLKVVVHARRTPWPKSYHPRAPALLPPPPPLPSPPPPSPPSAPAAAKVKQHTKDKSKRGGKVGRGKHTSHHVDSQKLEDP